MMIFLMLTLIHLPLMYMYKSYGNYSHETELFKQPLKFSLGSMGFANTKCTNAGMETDKIVLSCNTGNVTKIVDFGINAKFEDRDICF